MGLFNKKKKNSDEETGKEASESKQTEKKPKSDKAIKERSPKPMMGMKLIRTCFWVFMCFIVFKGCMSFTQGTKIVNQTIVNGSTTPTIEDKVKG